jgi:uncharacterized protein YdcH (DUF465 family)
MRRGVFSVNFALWGAPREEFLDMCDYSLHSVRTRPAKVGEKLVTHNFGTGTRGFAAPEDCSVAVCVLPGTELAFETPVKYQTILMLRANTGHTVAIFRQINKGALHINHDALEFPDGEIVLLTRLFDEVNRNIYRIESGEEPTTDEVLARLKKWRLKFKDEIAAILTRLEHRM